MAFKQKMEQSAKKSRSKIILALDLPKDKPTRLLSRSLDILELTHSSLCAVKINRQLLLPLGLFNGVQKIINHAHDLGLPTVMDCKVNDIGSTNRAIAESYYEAGFDALIANPFVGWEDGLQPVFEVAEKKHRGVIILVFMSHKGASEGYGQMVQDPRTKHVIPQYRIFAKRALEWNADGAIVGATYPKTIRAVHEILGEKVPIYSPGISVQGGDIKIASNSGTRYFIVGRAIIQAEDVMQAAEHLRMAAQQLTYI